MTPVEYMDLLNRIEASCPVDTWMIRGTRIWPLLRVGLVFQFDEYAKGYVKDTLVDHGINMLRDLRACAAATLRDLEHSQSPNAPAEVAFLTTTLDRTLRLHGEWYNAYCDPIIESASTLGLRALVFESSGNKAVYRTPRHGQSAYVQPALNTLAALSVLRDPAPRTDHWSGFDEFMNQLTRATDIRRDGVLGILRRFAVVRRWATYFGRHLERSQARAAFVVSWYGPLGMAFVLACRERHIPVVDIQHGVAEDIHVSYGRWHRIPERGFELMPTHFWRWSEAEKKTIESWAGTNGRHHTVVAGHPLVQLFRDGGSPLAIATNAEVERVLEPGFEHVLVTLQATGVNDLYLQLFQRAPKNWFFWIRPHPAFPLDIAETTKRLARIEGLRFNLVDAARLALPALIRRMAVHVTEFSSSVLEAEMFGVPSVVTHPSARACFPAQISSGVALEALDVTTALEAISRQMQRAQQSAPQPALSLTRAIKQIMG